MMRSGGWNSRKQRKYSYKGKTVLAINKPEAAFKFNLYNYKDIAQVKKVK